MTSNRGVGESDDGGMLVSTRTPSVRGCLQRCRHTVIRCWQLAGAQPSGFPLQKPSLHQRAGRESAASLAIRGYAPVLGERAEHPAEKDTNGSLAPGWCPLNYLMMMMMMMKVLRALNAPGRAASCLA